MSPTNDRAPPATIEPLVVSEAKLVSPETAEHGSPEMNGDIRPAPGFYRIIFNFIKNFSEITEALLGNNLITKFYKQQVLLSYPINVRQQHIS